MSFAQGWKLCTWLPRHRLILATIILVEAFLFLGYHWERWTKSLLPRNQDQTSAGEALIIRNDGLGYYAWLRSCLIDGDLSFDDEFDEHNPVNDYVPPVACRTENGLRCNPWSVGPALIWALLIVPAHAAVVFLQQHGLPWAADGYSLPYQILVGATTLLASWLGVGLLYRICRCFSDKEPAAMATAFLMLGTSIVYYSALEPSMAHGLATTALAALLWFWLRTYGSVRWHRWFVLGLLVGFAALMRWQLLTFAVLPLGETALAVVKSGSARTLDKAFKSLIRLLLAGAGTLIAVFPQLSAWRLVYGRWLVAPYATAHNWANPSWWQILFSQDRGLFYWTPIALMAFVASLLCLVDARRPAERNRPNASSGEWGIETFVLLFAAYILHVYFLASLWGAEVYLGVSFGLRQLTEAQVALAPGLALLFQKAAPRNYRVLAYLACLLVFWNLVLISQYRYGYLPAAGGADPAELMTNTLRLVSRKRFLLIGQTMIGPVLLILLLRRPASLDMSKTSIWTRQQATRPSAGIFG